MSYFKASVKVLALALSEILYDVNAAGTTVITVTHNLNIIEKSGKRAVFLKGGKIVSDTKIGGNE